MDRFLHRAALPWGRRNKLRWTGTQFPCQASAQDAEMSLREYEDFVYRACHVDDGTPDPVGYWQAVRLEQAKRAAARYC